MTAEIVVQGDIFKALSPNAIRRLHHFELARRRRDWKGRVRLAWHQAGCPVFSGKVRVQITLRRCRKGDPDNAHAAAYKAVLDSLVACGCIRDDSERYVELAPVEQLSGICYRGREAVVVQISPAAGALPLE